MFLKEKEDLVNEQKDSRNDRLLKKHKSLSMDERKARMEKGRRKSTSSETSEG